MGVNMPEKTCDDSLALDIKNLTVHYVLEDEVVEAVNDISIQLEKRKILGLVGETGAGKSIVIDAMGAVLGGRTSRDLIRTGAERAVDGARGARLGLHLDDLHRGSEDVLHPLGCPLVDMVGHGAGRRDGVNPRNFGERIRYVCGGLVAVHGLELARHIPSPLIGIQVPGAWCAGAFPHFLENRWY